MRWILACRLWADSAETASEVVRASGGACFGLRIWATLSLPIETKA